jgi:5-phospho-D-xylono-1,4-lactonase
VIRTVLGDIDSDSLGFCHAHEHVLIQASIGTGDNPDLLIDDVGAAIEEVNLFSRAGGNALVDAMPLDSGRNPDGLVEVSQRTGTHIVATTGFHTRRYYEPGHWSERIPVQDIADLLAAEITIGMDRFSHGGPQVDRTTARAGVVKVATDEQGIDGRAARLMEAAAECHHRTGAPILTHTERGLFAIEQIEFLRDLEVLPAAVLVSHVDRICDRGFHAALADTGAYLVYDGPSREKYHPVRVVAELIGAVVENGGEQRVLLGMDLALRSYRLSTGGEPGLAFVLERFIPLLHSMGFTDDQVEMFGWRNPAAALSFRG